MCGKNWFGPVKGYTLLDQLTTFGPVKEYKLLDPTPSLQDIHNLHREGAQLSTGQ
jgi:hypothetical protein